MLAIHLYRKIICYKQAEFSYLYIPFLMQKFRLESKRIHRGRSPNVEFGPGNSLPNKLSSCCPARLQRYLQKLFDWIFWNRLNAERHYRLVFHSDWFNAYVLPRYCIKARLYDPIVMFYCSVEPGGSDALQCSSFRSKKFASCTSTTTQYVICLTSI